MDHLKSEKKILIIGAGLCGSLLAVRLGKLGFNVVLVEKRADLRKVEMAAGRSINLALSDRGLKALRLVGLEDRVREFCIPMRGRMIHGVSGQPRFSSYSGRSDEYINSVSRTDLNTILIEEADVHDNVEIIFEADCVNVNIDKSIADFKLKDGKDITIDADIIIGTDGAGSKVRKEIFEKRSDENLSVEFLEHGYKELEIPPGPDGTYQLEKNALHIWPRGSYMIIALPNMNGSFTVTMFNAYKGEHSFEEIDKENGFVNYIESKFPDLMEFIDDLSESYIQNPVGRLGTIKCFPWQDEGKTLIMGDAAHAIVPFYGQGMNAAFEDVTVFSEVLDQEHSDWESVFKMFQTKRHPSAVAIADLAIDNFYEMRDHVADPVFIKKRQLEMQLEQEYPEYYSKYSMVTFNENIPYEQAKEKGRKQDDYLMEICRENDIASIDKEELLNRLKEI